MQYADRVIVKVVETYCAARGIEVALGLDGWLIVLSKNDRKHFIYGYDLGLNGSVAHRIANDKSATSDVLGWAGVACVPHTLVMNHDHFKYQPRGGNWSRMLEMLRAHPAGLVLKPNDGTCGHLVFRVADELALERAAAAILGANQNLAIAPYLEIDREVRVVVLDRQPLVVYEKKRPVLVGDGTRSALQLLLGAVPPQRLGEVLANLPPNTARLDEVLPNGQAFPLDWRHNLDLGAEPALIDDGPLRDASVALATRAADAIGLSFGSVDVVWTQDRAQILEINSGVMIESLHRWHPDLAHRVYGRALDQVLHRMAD
jgi:glutathione synthase/RimK-type ligase-like ATP-grasp enzyme